MPACAGNPWRGNELFSCPGEVRHVVIGGDHVDACQPIAVLACCDRCVFGVSTWLQTVARYDEGFVVSYATWLRATDLPDLDNPVRAVV